ncbi:hypothetical protein [Paraburkholderia phenoliruptrix]|uniref:hypothetical protein n=1 Tax=Paraburkholderia phenoliruptrix TaxID=252970 RepID=UPI001C6DEFE5|nr:hypothetical protein [Paraburkholderia phenoliruptrix]MBW9104124.1 hypothetical protein [Paraburkholderia phenoliruptrix]MBW9130711.1 hypothetical protein [Paraburkholderia ginsengiterrae]
MTNDLVKRLRGWASSIATHEYDGEAAPDLSGLGQVLTDLVRQREQVRQDELRKKPKLFN